MTAGATRSCFPRSHTPARGGEGREEGERGGGGGQGRGGELLVQVAPAF